MLPFLKNCFVGWKIIPKFCFSSERLTAGLSAPRGLGEDAGDGVEKSRRPPGGGGAGHQLSQVPEAAAGSDNSG